MPEAYAAIDLGATSGRVVTGRLQGDRMALEEVHRFHNRPVRLPDGLRWNLLHLFTEALEGLRRAGPLAGVGVDTWAVDYALLDADGRVLGLPFHYRDDRTAGMDERAFGRVPQAELYAATGIQTLPINTVFQLLADEGSAALAAAERLALVPDLLAYWLCGELANESTNASTTGLLDARSGEWAGELIDRLGLPRGIFGALIEPGSALGPLLGHHELGPVTTYAVASHDTASAFAAAPVRDEHAAILSSGTWSLLGLELPEPVLSDAAREANLTNERGVDGTTRLLKNVMGMWLLEECRRAWGEEASYEELQRLAESVEGDVPLFDPDDGDFLAPGDMPARIAAACERSGQAAPPDVADDRAQHHGLARLQVPLGDRAPGGGQRPRRAPHPCDRRRRAQRAAVAPDRRHLRPRGARRPGRGDRARQRARAGARGGRARLAGRAARRRRGVREPTVDEPAPEREAAEETYRRFLDVTGLRARTTA